MKRRTFRIKRKKVSKMAAYATPKGSSYVVKRECVQALQKSKLSQSNNKIIKDRAQAFKVNNLDRK